MTWSLFTTFLENLVVVVVVLIAVGIFVVLAFDK